MPCTNVCWKGWPVSLSDVKHQGAAQRMIQRAFIRERTPHAYLFHGPDGVGKEMLACGLAGLLLCGNPIDHECPGDETEDLGLERLRNGCGSCEECRLVSAGTHPDLHLVYRQLNRDHPDPEVRRRKGLDLGVDVLRHFVIERVILTPARGRAKVFVIREADRITPQAQNALLKTLEEPPGTTFIILLVQALDRMLPTTQSRCQIVRFGALPTEFVRARLAELRPDLPSAQVTWYARCSDGSLGAALENADDELFVLNRKVIETLGRCGNQGGDDIVKAWTEESKALGDRYRRRDPEITDTEATRRGFKALFRLAATFCSDVLRYSTGDPSSVVNAGLQGQIDRTATSVTPTLAADRINRIALAERQLDLNANTQLCIEALIDDLT